MIDKTRKAYIPPRRMISLVEHESDTGTMYNICTAFDVSSSDLRDLPIEEIYAMSGIKALVDYIKTT